ncbi:hypothetical protein F5B20DRAFT_579816 [Whalleya microplaca]|nr:hypothetical protein F5B20DRAFT_579816 [Whalleya microplaca]
MKSLTLTTIISILTGLAAAAPIIDARDPDLFDDSFPILIPVLVPIPVDIDDLDSPADPADLTRRAASQFDCTGDDGDDCGRLPTSLFAALRAWVGDAWDGEGEGQAA